MSEERENDRGITGDVEAYEMRCLPAAENAAVSPDVTDSEAELLEDVVKEKGTGESGDEGKGSLRRGINLLDATGMVIGGIIGSGIFITPAIILDLTGSFGVSMLCWVAGMIIAVCGGLCFVELALLHPRTGGAMVYILEAFSFKNRNKWTRLLGQLLAFLYSWASIVIIRPTSLSIISLACTRYLSRPFYLDCEIPKTLLKCLALAIIILLSVIMIRGVKIMAKISTVITAMKVLTVVFIVIVGIAGVIQRGDFPESFHRPFQGTEVSSAAGVGSIVIGLYSVLFAYDGWDGIGFSVEEVKKPERTLPRATVIGLTVVSVSYMLVNLSFFSVLSSNEIAGTKAVALPFGEAVMGKAGLVIFPLLVALSAFGAALLSFYLATRMIFSSSREGMLPEVFCGTHKKWKTPVAAIVFHVSH
jgi:L-type amino acid transporter 9